MQSNDLRRRQRAGDVDAEDSPGEQRIQREGCNRGDERRRDEPQPTHSTGESCEKQSPPERQRDVDEQTRHGDYWMKTPDPTRSVTKK